MAGVFSTRDQIAVAWAHEVSSVFGYRPPMGAQNWYVRTHALIALVCRAAAHYRCWIRVCARRHASAAVAALWPAVRARAGRKNFPGWQNLRRCDRQELARGNPAQVRGQPQTTRFLAARLRGGKLRRARCG